MRSTINGIRIAALALFGYWCVLFISTHIPTRIVQSLHANDKFLHFGAYFVLAFLLAWALPTNPKRPLVNVFWALVVAIGYAGFDELTQIPVGRTADWQDFYADVAGACSGLVIYLAIRTGLIKAKIRLFEPVPPKASRLSGNLNGSSNKSTEQKPA